MSLIEHDDVIQTSPAYGTDYAFDKGIWQGERGAVSTSSIPRRLSDLGRDVVRYVAKISKNDAAAVEFAYRTNRGAQNPFSLSLIVVIAGFESTFGPSLAL